MRIRQRPLLVAVATVAMAASVLPFPGSAPQRSNGPQRVDQVRALPVAAVEPDY